MRCFGPAAAFLVALSFVIGSILLGFATAHDNTVTLSRQKPALESTVNHNNGKTYVRRCDFRGHVAVEPETRRAIKDDPFGPAMFEAVRQLDKNAVALDANYVVVTSPEHTLEGDAYLCTGTWHPTESR